MAEYVRFLHHIFVMVLVTGWSELELWRYFGWACQTNVWCGKES